MTTIHGHAARALAAAASAAMLAACGASDTIPNSTSTAATASASGSCDAATTQACAVVSGGAGSASAASAGACKNLKTGQTDVLQQPGLALTAQPDGLQIADLVPGTGGGVASGQTLTVNYTGWLQDGTIFDSSCRSGAMPFSFPLGAGQVIKGWDEGLTSVKIGGQRRLVIPPALAYGAKPPSGLPANATLTFDIEVVSAK